jgi:hypothetical protein
VNGYGAFKVGDRQVKAHRWAYEQAYGPIPKGLVVMHACDVKLCVRPGHLMAGPTAANQRDMTAKGRGRIGTRNGSAILTEADVRAIRREYVLTGKKHANGTRAALALRFGISGVQVHRIVTREVWDWLPD